jgi:hypothetical protein
VEGDINARKRDGGKSTLELDITFRFLLFLSLLKTRFDNVAETKKKKKRIRKRNSPTAQETMTSTSLGLI